MSQHIRSRPVRVPDKVLPAAVKRLVGKCRVAKRPVSTWNGAASARSMETATASPVRSSVADGTSPFTWASLGIAYPQRHMPCRQTALRQRQRLHDQRLCGSEVSGRTTRLRAVYTSRSLFAYTAKNQGQAGIVLPGQSRWTRKLHRQDESPHRQPGRAYPIWPTLRHGGACVREFAAQQTTQPLYVERAKQSGRTVETLLFGTQHREISASRVRAVKEGG